MKLKRWMQVILIGCSIVTLAACATRHKQAGDQSAINEANAAYSDNGQAQASGLGEESRFGDQAGGQRVAANKRVYYFDYDSNVVHDQDKPSIASNADYLAAHPQKKIMLEGHTDPRGSREYNIGLGERRAKAVAQILTAKGVNRSQVRVVSYGAEKLASVGRSEPDYQRDRRSVIVFSQQ